MNFDQKSFKIDFFSKGCRYPFEKSLFLLNVYTLTGMGGVDRGDFFAMLVGLVEFGTKSWVIRNVCAILEMMIVNLVIIYCNHWGIRVLPFAEALELIAIYLITRAYELQKSYRKNNPHNLDFEKLPVSVS